MLARELRTWQANMLVRKHFNLHTHTFESSEEHCWIRDCTCDMIWKRKVLAGALNEHHFMHVLHVWLIDGR